MDDPLSPLNRLKHLLHSKQRSDARILFLAKNWIPSPTEPDFDFLAVVAFPSLEWLQIQSPRDKLSTTILSSEKPIFRVDELFKFCDLLWRGDIVAVEALYLEEDAVFEAPEWKELVSHRRSFAINRLLLSHYAGQPRAQLLHKTVTVDWYNVWKWLYEAEQLLQGLEPIVLWDKRGNKEKCAFLHTLRESRRGNDIELREKTLSLIRQFERQLNTLKQLEKSNTNTSQSSTTTPGDSLLGASVPDFISPHLVSMPVQASKDFINAWMISLRRAMLSEHL